MEQAMERETASENSMRNKFCSNFAILMSVFVLIIAIL